MVDKQHNEFENLPKELLKTLTLFIEEKDKHILEHSQRVASMCVFIARKISNNKKEIEKIYLAGLLHDIGKVFTPIDVGENKGKLDEKDHKIMKEHPVIAERILSNLSMLKGILPIIRHHHEAVDGSGYPDGINGDSISWHTKILGLADKYDHLTSDNNGDSKNTIDALEEIKKGSGHIFDENLVKIFEKVLTVSYDANSKDTKVEEDKKEPEQHEYVPIRNEILKIVKKFKEGKIDLPVLSRVVQEIQRIIGKPTSTVESLAAIIETDAVISIKLISVANSAAYRGAEKIKTVKDAVPRLGVKETQSTVATIASKSIFETKNKLFKTLIQKLWLHSLSTAYGSRIIAQKKSMSEWDRAFFMGLVHDIGKALLIRGLSGSFQANDSVNMEEILEIIQEFHSQVGGGVLKSWGFAQDYIKIATQYEGPNFRETTNRMVLVVNLASNISHNIGFTLTEREEVDLLELESAKLLQLNSNTIEKICEEVKETMKKSSAIFD